MYIIRGLKNMAPQFLGAVVAIGNFDGVHRGHQALFAKLRSLARAHDSATVMAVTFEPHPLRLLDPKRTPVRVTGLRGKARWMEEQGVDALFILHFNRALASMTPKDFVCEYLVKGLGVREVLVGENFRFGAKGAGSFNDLLLMGQACGFGVHSHPLVYLDDRRVSSTWVRQAVEAADFTLAARLLNRDFEIEGRVIGGHKRGRGLGFPTANMALPGMLYPLSGVYVAEGWVQGDWLPAVVNVGHNPTFGDAETHLEAHLLVPLAEDLYRKVLRIRFLKRLRSEIKFLNVESLKRQITQDVADAKGFFLKRDGG